MAATVGAGVQDGEMFEALAAQNALAVGGTSNDVGVVGWATGGGHGFATGKYGQGADNILEAEIVTPAGNVLIANQCQNQDLYWAIRGGGGGTFGVITKLTVKAYHAPTVVIGGFDIRAKNQTSEDEFYKFIADVHALFPAIQDAGIHGYYTVTGIKAYYSDFNWETYLCGGYAHIAFGSLKLIGIFQCVGLIYLVEIL
ncbi:hypothetical protein LB505_013750 [Fusarium chuoi]|nr:hypothetical protein LB505_013750 [Fusarium chuoi]